MNGFVAKQIRDQSGFEAIWLQCFLGAPMGHSKAEKAKTHFADCIKKDVKDVMDADELRNKIKYVSTACFARIRPSLRHSV
jgi:hypothetical protein